jgi:hypothetical protein
LLEKFEYHPLYVELRVLLSGFIQPGCPVYGLIFPEVEKLSILVELGAVL